MPYVKDARLFEVPGTREFWHFNPNLSNVSLAKINEAAQTVLLYDGTDQKLNFRWGDSSPVCFVDGHVALISREQAPDLRWKP